MGDKNQITQICKLHLVCLVTLCEHTDQFKITQVAFWKVNVSFWEGIITLCQIKYNNMEAFTTI